MRLRSFTASDHARAMAEVRATLGDDAVIVATQELGDGSVRITAAVENDDIDLAELLAPASEDAMTTRWLASLADHHELSATLRRRLHEIVAGLAEAEPAAALSHALHGMFDFAPLPPTSEVPLLLTGPPGVGKTASIAKLAARAVLAGRTAHVITTDVSRAGGIEQLAALLAPLSLEPAPAADVAGLEHAIASAAADIVLIDSPGLNPFRPADLGRLPGLIKAGGAEPILVLSGGLGVADCHEIAHTYAALGARRMLITKLDTSRRLGGVLAAAEAGLAFCDAGIGPNIGQSLCPIGAPGLARLLLHTQASAAAGVKDVRPALAAADQGGAR